MNPKLTSLFSNILRYFLLVASAIIIIFPIYYAIISSLEPTNEVVSGTPHFFPHTIRFSNYMESLQLAPLGRFILNSGITSTIIVCAQLLTSSLAAYAFVFLRFKGRTLVFYLVLSTMMIPTEVTIIPNYLTIRSLHWLNSYTGLTAPFLAGSFGIFLLRQYFAQLPFSLFEAAIMDGCGHLRFFASIAIPLVRPALGTLSVYAFLQSWNQYLWPLLVTNSTQMRTVQIGLGMLQNQDALAWNVVMAGVVIVLLPTLLLLIFGQKQLVRGITSGSVKG